MRPRALPLCACLAALLLAGCAADTTNYPSLARRPAERIEGTAEVVPGPPAQAEAPPLPSADLAARLARLTGEADAAHRDFLGKRERAAALVAAAHGAAVASESWSVASVALAELEAARSRAMIALADLDSLYAEARINGGAYEAIGTNRSRVIALVGEEDGVLANLRGQIAG